MVQVCLNGSRSAADGPGVPMSPAELARSAAEAVAAGATSVHVHPKTPCGHDSLSPRVLAPVLDALRARVRVPVGVTTGAWAEPDPAARLARVRSWTALPDFASRSTGTSRAPRRSPRNCSPGAWAWRRASGPAPRGRAGSRPRR